MNKISIFLFPAIMFSFTGCTDSPNAAINSQYGIDLPKCASIQQVSADKSSFRAELTNQQWEKWEVERYGFSKWIRFVDWQFFDMRDFAIEQKPGQEKYYASRIDGFRCG
jgi:hypothetical protein